MQVCLLCEQATGNIRMMPDGPRHLGMDGCIMALRQALEAERMRPAQGGQGESEPVPAEVAEWYKQFRLARELITPKVMLVGQHLELLSEQLMATGRVMRDLDAMMIDLIAAHRLAQKYDEENRARALEAGIWGPGGPGEGLEEVRADPELMPKREQPLVIRIGSQELARAFDRNGYPMTPPQRCSLDGHPLTLGYVGHIYDAWHCTQCGAEYRSTGTAAATASAGPPDEEVRAE